MACIDVKDIVEEYGKVEDLVKEICTDRACTLETIQKSLKTRNIEITESALLAVIAKIEGMIIFEKEGKYDVGDALTYRHYYFSIIYVGVSIGNVIMSIVYKNFYLCDEKRCKDKAFREHIFSKLEFEELRRVAVNNPEGLKKALDYLNIEKDKWMNYVTIDNNGLIFCKKWHKLGEFSSTECLGKLVRKFPSE
jgi:hypothetical protein